MGAASASPSSICHAVPGAASWETHAGLPRKDKGHGSMAKISAPKVQTSSHDDVLRKSAIAALVMSVDKKKVSRACFNFPLHRTSFSWIALGL